MSRPFKLREDLSYQRRETLRYMDLDTKGFHVIALLTKEEWNFLTGEYDTARTAKENGLDQKKWIRVK